MQSVLSLGAQRVKFSYSAKYRNCLEFLQSSMRVVKITFSKKSLYIIARVTIERNRKHLNARSFVYNSVKVILMFENKQTPF